MADALQVVTQQARADAVFVPGVDRSRRQVDDTGRSGAVIHRESAGIDLGPTHRGGIEGTEETLKALEMKRIDERNPVKLDQDVVGQCASDIRPRREIGGKPWRGPHRLHRIALRSGADPGTDGGASRLGGTGSELYRASAPVAASARSRSTTVGGESATAAQANSRPAHNQAVRRYDLANRQTTSGRTPPSHGPECIRSVSPLIS